MDDYAETICITRALSCECGRTCRRRRDPSAMGRRRVPAVRPPQAQPGMRQRVADGPSGVPALRARRPETGTRV